MIGRSLASRLTVLNQALAIVIIVGFAGSAVLLTERAQLRDERALLRMVARRSADNLDRELAEEGTLPLAVASLLAEEVASRVRIDVLSAKGALLGSLEDSSAGDDPLPAARRLSFRGSERHTERWPARCGAVVIASASSADRDEQVTRLALALFSIAVPFVGLAFVASRWITARALGPLDAMRRRIAETPSHAPLHGRGASVGFDEIDALTGAFNLLLTRLDEHLLAERRFTAEASHELRTPLTVLTGEIEMALAEQSLSAAARDGLERALEQARHMQQLVEALLLLRRASDAPAETLPGFEPVNIADLVRDARHALVQRSHDRASDVAIDVPDEVMVTGDSALVASAIWNLMDNALKFTRVGEPVSVTLRAESGVAILSVDDGGRGIDEADLPRIFDPFFRGAEARATTPGLGLGLPILARVIRAHNGDVSVGRSTSGGARFILRLPLWSTPRRT